ncbi:MAG: hypothetical protein JRE81_03965 [Deltaproteobacteria bacterium]|jgi:hypothetical protein|nr:hypothetical protein [Deltaproteobacteria bacterium]
MQGRIVFLAGFAITLLGGCSDSGDVDNLAASVSGGCESSCADACRDLIDGDRKDCLRECIGGRCGNTGILSAAEATGETGIGCFPDGECNDFCDDDPDCWEVSATANGSYQNQYGWDITKTVDPSEQSGVVGDTLEWTWSITWSSFFVEESNHQVLGEITVANLSAQEVTVDVSAELIGGLPANVVCNDADGGTDLTIQASGEGTCDYSADPNSQLARCTATITKNGVSVSDTVDVTWTLGDDLGLDATIVDTSGISIPIDSVQPFQYVESVECSTVQSGSRDNAATITWTGGSDSESATTVYECTATCPCWDENDLSQIYQADIGQVGDDPGPVCEFGIFGSSGGPLLAGAFFRYGDNAESVVSKLGTSYALLYPEFPRCSFCPDPTDESGCTDLLITVSEQGSCDSQIRALAESMGLECQSVSYP